MKKLNEIESDHSKYLKWLSLLPLSVLGVLILIMLDLKTDKAQSSAARVKTEVGQAVAEQSELPEKVEKRLAAFPEEWAEIFKEKLDLQLLVKLEQCSSLEEAVIILSKDVDASFDEEHFKRWLRESAEELLDPERSTWGGLTFNELEIHDQLCALASYLLRDQKFKYGDEITPDLYQISKVIQRREGYCATLPVIFALLSEKLQLPVYIVQGAQHLFNRYDDGVNRINIETTNPLAMGVGTPDDFYLNGGIGSGLQIPKAFLETTTTLKSMNLKQTISALLVNNAASLNEANDFKGFSANSLPKDENKLEKLNQYMLTALYFDRHNVLPIKNLLTLMERRPEIIGDGSFYSSLRSYAVRKTVKMATPEDINKLYAEMQWFLKRFQKFNSSYREYMAGGTANNLKEGSSTARESLIALSKKDLTELENYHSANKHILPKDIDRALTSVMRTYRQVSHKLNEKH